MPHSTRKPVGKPVDDFIIVRSKKPVAKPSEKEIQGMRQREIIRKNPHRTA